MTITDWLRTRITDYTPGVGRVFVVCRECTRVVPYYRLYGRGKSAGCPHCGHLYFRPAQIPEWRAALWVIWGWVSRQGDPRMPFRLVDSRYA